MMNSAQSSFKSADLGQNARSEERIVAWHVRASQGDADTRKHLATYYAQPEIAGTAVANYQADAAAGKISAMIKLGYLYATGTLVARDEDRAFSLYSDALLNATTKAYRKDVEAMMTGLLGRPFKFVVKSKSGYYVNLDGSKAAVTLG